MSKELRSARQLVSNTLTFLGYEPEWQDIFSTEEGDLREMLRRRIDACKAVVQVVGHCYGGEPPAPCEQFGRVSYTQYEALYARQRKKKVWYLILSDDFTTDPHEPESQEFRGLQVAYRARLKSESVIRHTLGTRDALEANVLKLRDELTRLRRGVKQWALAVIALLLLGVCVGFFHWRSTSERLAGMDDKMEKLLRQGMVQLPDVQNKVRQEEEAKADPAEVQKRTYEALAKQLGVDATVLEQKLPLFADQLRKDPNASTYERSTAAYVAKDYDEAERLALVAADEATKDSRTSDAIKAFELAGNSADARIEYARALHHYRAAAQLTDRTRDALEWAGQQWKIAVVLLEQGKYAEADATYRNALAEYQRARGEEDPDVLALRSNLAIALKNQGKYAEAEAELRETVKMEEKVLGAEHPDTLRSRMTLANIFYSQNNYAEAEMQFRDIIKLEEKVLGPEHPFTIGSRGNLAGVLDDLGKHVEAEMLCREVVTLREKVLGPEHPDTLAALNNLAIALKNQGKYAEAEKRYREVIRLREKVLGPGHPDTLISCFNLALCLKAEVKMDEARPFAQRAAEGAIRNLGADHPYTLRCQMLWQELQQH